MRKEVNYLLSVGERSLGLGLVMERTRELGFNPPDAIVSIFGQSTLPFFTEIVNRGIHGMSSIDGSKISTGRAIVYTCLGVAGAFAGGAVDMVGDVVSLAVGVNNPAEGIALKGAINAGSHMLMDSIKYSVHNPPNFRGISMAAV